MVLWQLNIQLGRGERMDFQIGRSVLIKIDLSPWGIGDGPLIHEGQVVALDSEKVTLQVHDLEISNIPLEDLRIRDIRELVW